MTRRVGIAVVVALVAGGLCLAWGIVRALYSAVAHPAVHAPDPRCASLLAEGRVPRPSHWRELETGDGLAVAFMLVVARMPPRADGMTHIDGIDLEGKRVSVLLPEASLSPGAARPGTRIALLVARPALRSSGVEVVACGIE